MGQFDTWRAQGAVGMNSQLWGRAVCVGVQQGCHYWSWHCSNWCGRANLPWNQEASQECSTLLTVNSERLSAYHLPIYGEFLFSCLWATSLSTANIHFVLLRPWVIDEAQSVSNFRTEHGSWRKPVNTLHPLMSMIGSVMDTWPRTGLSEPRRFSTSAFVWTMGWRTSPPMGIYNLKFEQPFFNNVMSPSQIHKADNICFFFVLFSLTSVLTI